MPLSAYQHIVEELDGIKCSVIEKNSGEPRALFLKKVLEHNGLTVVVKKNIPAPPKPPASPPVHAVTAATTAAIVPPPPIPEVPSVSTYTIGVTDILFNAVISVYERKMQTPDGKLLTPAYWEKEKEDTKEWYWKE